MSQDDYRNDPNFYLAIAGGCSALVCCLVCIAKNWDDPPDWVHKSLQPRWKVDYFYPDDTSSLGSKDTVVLTEGIVSV